ncbi:hypothetical protein H0H87_009119 [Tephrocybe sp. NHM501043]|nr:hypothetical protein H0H87_009119 [Tephrocybe sp. NHM501043]
MAWGGEAEQDAERAAGKLNAKIWYDEAMQIVEDAMRTYWATRPQAATATVPKTQPAMIIVDDFDLHRQTLLTRKDSEGWQAELCQYLKDVPADISRDTDIVEYWQDHCQVYPMLGCMALDVIPCHTSSVPCEHLFSASKQTADDCHACLCATTFEQLQIMKFAWCSKTMDIAAINSQHVEEINVEPFQELLGEDHDFEGWDKDGLFVDDLDVDL